MSDLKVKCSSLKLSKQGSVYEFKKHSVVFLIAPFSTYIFHSLDSHSVNEVGCGEVNDDGVNVPGPLPQ